MKFIDPKSHIVTQIFTKRLEEIRAGKKKLQWVDSTFEDFDGTRYHIRTDDEEKSSLTLSVNIPYFDDLEGKKGDATKHLKKVFGDLVCETELNFNFSAKVNLADEKQQDDDVETLIDSLAMVKAHAFAAPCKKAFAAAGEGKKFSRLINITSNEQLAIVVKEGDSKVNCTFALHIESDPILTNMFFSELMDTRKKPDMNGTPTVIFQPSKPSNFPKTRHQGPFLTLGLDTTCYTGPREKDSIDLLVNFRPYVSYHLKCNKAHIHERMRNKLAELLKVMNRARFKQKGKGGKKKPGLGRKKTAKKGGKKSPPPKKKSGKKKSGKKGPPKRKGPPPPPK